MKREDIQYFNSWSKSFKKCSMATIMKGLLNGIWISSNKDPEDIYRIFPKLITTETGGSAEVCKQFGTIPFEFSFDDSEFDENDKLIWKRKGRLMSGYKSSWALDRYEMRKAVTKTGLWYANKYKITKEEVKALHKKYGWDDESAYKELMTNRSDLMITTPTGYVYEAIDANDYKYIRAAFCPHFDTGYNWMDYPEKAGYPEIPNIDNRSYDWEAE